MVYDALDWIFNTIALIFSVIVSNWLLAAFLFVSILYLVVDLVKIIRNK